MLLAVIGDIHGNSPALNAVLDAVDEAGIMTIIHTGDAVVGYPWPNEVVERLRDHNVICVQGECDRAAVRFGRSIAKKARMNEAMFAATEWTFEHLNGTNREWLGALPRVQRVRVEGIDICAFHGTPASQTEGLRDDTNELRMQRVREDGNAPLLCCGHSHDAFTRWLANTLIVNPGSAGIAVEVPGTATYAIVDTDSTPWCAAIHEVQYDVAELESKIKETGLADPQTYLPGP